MYGCYNSLEFKQKLETYEKLRWNYETHTPEVEIKSKSKPVKTAIRYFICGDDNHMSINWNNEEKDPRCWLNYGHKSYECTKSQEAKFSKESLQVNTVTCS